MDANYQYFIVIAESKSISKAADSLFISQPSLSKYLKRLEGELGVKLVDRSKKPIKLTYAGELLYDYYQRGLIAEKNLKSKIDEYKNGGYGSINVGISQWRSNTLIADFMPTFMMQNPQILVQFTEGRALVLERLIAEEQVDFALMNLPINYANTYYTVITEEHLLLAGRKDDPFIQEKIEKCGGDLYANYHKADIHDFVGKPFVLTMPGQHITHAVEKICSRNDIQLKAIMRTSNVSTAVNLAVQGLGYTFIPEFGTKSRFFPKNELELFYIDDPPCVQTFTAVYKRSRYLTAPSIKFIAELKAFAAERMDS